jgi:hypothetical protein
MTRNSTLRVLVAGLLVVATGMAAFSKVGTTGASFLKIAYGRATAMGDAFVGVADDPSASYFNPAGLARVGRSIQLNHSEWIADVRHENVAVVLPASWGTVCLHATALTMGDMEVTLIDDPTTAEREDEGIGLMFGANDIAVAASYARIITDKLSFGLTARFVQQTVWRMTASAMAADLGLHYNTGFRSLRIGAGVNNYGSRLSFTGRDLEYGFNWPDSGPSSLIGMYKTEGVPLPTTFRFGIAYDLVDVPASKLTAAIDLVHPSDINETVNFGLEYGYNDLFFLRGGYILNTDVEYQEDIGWMTGLSAGVGLNTKPTEVFSIGLDYSFRYFEYIKPTHRLLLTLGF